LAGTAAVQPPGAGNASADMSSQADSRNLRCK
jgi:hypothetical protein